MTYTPRGFPKAAIDYIVEHGPQFTGPLAEAIGCDAGSLSNILAAAVSNGALVRDRKPHMGHSVNYYRLGDGVPLERPKDEPLQDSASVVDAAPPDRQHTGCARSHPHEDMSPECQAKADQARAAAQARRMLSLPEAPTCTESQAEPACEFAITSTGRLLIDTGAQQVALSKAQAEQLMAYLDAQRGVEWEAA